MFNRKENREIEPREKAEVEREDTRPGLVFRPEVDILERADAYVIHADMPGASQQTVDIHLDKGVLTLDARLADFGNLGDFGTEAGAEESRPVYAEYRAGGYHREFRISEDVDPDAVSAKMKDGVLELLLPKSAKSQLRRIAVSAA